MRNTHAVYISEIGPRIEVVLALGAIHQPGTLAAESMVAFGIGAVYVLHFLDRIEKARLAGKVLALLRPKVEQIEVAFRVADREGAVVAKTNRQKAPIGRKARKGNRVACHGRIYHGVDAPESVRGIVELHTD